jgi:hypothetical protein
VNAGSNMKLILEAGQLSPGSKLSLQVQSMSPAGLMLLTADRAPRNLDRHLLGDRAAGGQPLRFVLEKDGRRVTLQAILVWLDLSSGTGEPSLEMIVDTGDEPGWWEVHTALAGN